MKKSLFSCLLILLFHILNAQTISTIAGTGVPGGTGDGGPAVSAQMNYIFYVACDPSGNLYVVDWSLNKVRKIATDGTITTFAGTGAGGYSGDGGPAVLARLSNPVGICVDKDGNVYIGDDKNNVVRKVDVSGVITTIAGNGTVGFSGDGGPATSAQLNNPVGLSIDNAGNLYIADYFNNRIRRVDKNGIITTVAGTGVQGYSGDGGPATSAALNLSILPIIDADGNIVIADSNNDRVRKIDKNGIITTIAGTGVRGYNGDGVATATQLNDPVGLFLDPSGAILLTDLGNNRIRKIQNGNITTIAGNGSAGFGGDGGNAISASLNNPVGICEDKNGNIYIADRSNYRIRKITAVVAAPPTITAFSPASAGNNSNVVITGTNFVNVTGVSFGGTAAKSFTVNSSIKITAKVGTGSSGSVAVSTTGGTASKPGFVFCLTPSVKIASDKASPVCSGSVVTFTAMPQNGGSNPAYQWQKNAVNVGTNSPTYVDSTLQTGDIVQCVLTSNASPCVTSSNVISNAITYNVNPSVVPSVTISANPGLLVCRGTPIQFSAATSNAGGNPVFQWLRNGVAVGTNSSAFIDITPETGDSISVNFTSGAACATPATVISDKMAEQVDIPTPVITIVANKDTAICGNPKVTFTATVKPNYLWKKNGAAVGTNSNRYLDSTLKNGDKVQCFVVSSATGCNSSASNIINSNILKFKVTAPPAIPSSIVGLASVTANQAGIYYSVTAVNGVTYIWSLPAGATIDSGQGGNKIRVTWGSTNGSVSVIAANSCGSSSARTKNVAVKSSLVKSAVTLDGAVKSNSLLDDDMRLAPNPASSWAVLTFNAKIEEKYTVTVADDHNRTLQIKNLNAVKGNNTVKINIAGYAKGSYFVILSSKTGGIKSKQLIIGE